MWHKLQYVMMAVPVLVSSWLCFSVEPPVALPVAQVYCFEYSFPEETEEVPVQVTQVSDDVTPGS